MAKRRKTPATPTIEGSYLPPTAQKLNIFMPGVLNMPNAGVHVPNKELEQVVNLLSVAGKAAKSIIGSVKGDTNASLGHFRMDGSQDYHKYKSDFESGDARIAEGDEQTLEAGFFAEVEATGNPATGAHNFAMSLAASNLGVMQDEQGRLVPNDTVSQQELDAYMGQYYEGMTGVLRNEYERYELERTVIHNEGVVFNLIYADSMPTGDSIYKEAVDTAYVKPPRKDIHLRQLYATAISGATEAGLYDRAEALLKKLPEDYGGRITLESNLIVGRRESVMLSFGSALAGVHGDNAAAWAMDDALAEALSATVTRPGDERTASTRMVETITSTLNEANLTVARKETFAKNLRNHVNSKGEALFPRASQARIQLNKYIDQLPSEYEQQRLKNLKADQEQTEARKIILAWLFDDTVTPEGTDVELKTIEQVQNHLRKTYDLGLEYSLELKELQAGRAFAEDIPDSRPKFSEIALLIQASTTPAERKKLAKTVWDDLASRLITTSNAVTLNNMIDQEVTYDAEKLDPSFINLFDRIEGAFYTAANAEGLLPPGPAGRAIQWMMPKNAKPGAHRQWMIIEDKLKSEWRTWVIANNTIRETDPETYLALRGQEILRLSELYLGAEGERSARNAGSAFAASIQAPEKPTEKKD